MKLAMDFDSTVFPLLDSMNRFPGGEKVLYADCHSWNHLPELCGGVNEMLDLFDKAMTYEAMNALGEKALYDGVHRVLNNLHSNGVEIHFVTDRPNERMSDTQDFLRDRGIPFNSINRVKSADKVQFCIDNGINVLVDDHPETLASAAASDGRVSALTIEQPYSANRARDLGIPVFANWYDLGYELERVIERAYQPIMNH